MSATTHHPRGSVSIVDRRGHRWATLSWPRAAVWAATLTPVLVAISLVRLAAPGTPWWPVPVLLTLAIATALLPDSPLGLVTLAALAGWWLLTVPDPSSGRTVVLATALLGFHLAVAHAAAGPPGFGTAGTVRLRMLVRAVPLLAVTTGVASLTALSGGWVPPIAVVAGTVLLIGALAWLVARP